MSILDKAKKTGYSGLAAYIGLGIAGIIHPPLIDAIAVIAGPGAGVAAVGSVVMAYATGIIASTAAVGGTFMAGVELIDHFGDKAEKKIAAKKLAKVVSKAEVTTTKTIGTSEISRGNSSANISDLVPAEGPASMSEIQTALTQLSGTPSVGKSKGAI